MMILFVAGCVITFPILFPVNGTSLKTPLTIATGGGGQTGLDILSFSNIADNNRYYAHVFVGWLYLGMNPKI